MKRVKLLLGVILLLSFSLGVFASEQVVILNSNDWRELYLGTIYAGTTGSDILYFSSLAEAQRKTETLPKWDSIVVLESKKNPVYKSYANYLDKKKYSNYELVEFDDYSDLQEMFFLNGDYSKYIILDTDFGLEAISVAPLVLTDNYVPVFVDFDNVKKIASKVRGADEIIVAGMLPIRLKNKFDYISYEYNDHSNVNSLEISKRVSNDLGSDWAVLANPSFFDLSFLLQKNPLFLYMGDTVEVAESIKETSVGKLEVGGNELADISKEIEQDTGRDLKLLVKYGQTITNLPGFEGKILDMDSIKFDSPRVNLELGEIEYFVNESILTVSVSNDGNIEANAFVTAEFGGQIYSTDDSVIVPIGEEITVPFVVDFSDADSVNLDIQYDYSDNLRFNLFSSDGFPIIVADVLRSDVAVPADVIIDAVDYDDTGRMLVTYENPNSEDIYVRADLILRNELIASSKEIVVPANGKEGVVIYTPYHVYEDFRSYETRLKTYYGVEDTIYVRDDVVKVDLIQGVIVFVAVGLALVLILLAAVVFAFTRKKKK